MPTADVGDALAVVSVPPDSDLLQQVIALGDAYKATLGLMPRKVYRERAAGGTVVAVLEGRGTPVGYALYEVARGRVRLVHLCVDAPARGRGVARLLVKEISHRHSDLRGIRVTCRADYAASALWPKLNFVPVNEIPGRGKDRHPLHVWWLDHGLPDLFSLDADEDLVTVAIDHMVFLDLAVNRKRSGAAESQVLVADWMADRIRLFTTPESLNEIQRLPNADDRRTQRAATTVYPPLTVSPSSFAAARETLLQYVSVEALSESDLNHVVYAAAAGAAVLATRDVALVTAVADAAEAALNLKVLLPTDVAVLLDQLGDAEKYRPAALRGTGYTVQDTPAGGEGDLEHLLAQSSGERGTRWRSLLRQLAADPTVTCQQVRDPDGHVIVAWASHDAPDKDALEVPLLRCAAAPMAGTVLQLLLFELKSLAVAAGRAAVTITEPHVSKLVATALADNGFTRERRWTALAPDARSRRSAAAALPPGHPWLSELEAGPAPATTAALERTLWPAKLLDCPLPNYIVSIQPRWARDLFSLDDTLFERATLLGISREHVYYRSPRGNPATPSRALWYASGKGRDRIGAVVACSQIVSATVDDPRRLYRRFSHLGVYSQDDVAAAGRHDRASALRFVDTERFPYPVSLERLRELAKDCPIGPLLSPTMISSSLFGAVYAEGTGRGGR